jgi:hypothetical protein
MQNWFSYDGVSTGASRLSTDHTHVFVDLVKGRDSLDDVVVLLVHAELDLSAGVCVTETKNGAVDVAGLELLDKLARVLAKTTEEVRDDLGGLGGFAGKVREGSLDVSLRPRVMVFFLPALGRLVSRVARKKSERIPSEMSLISWSASWVPWNGARPTSSTVFPNLSRSWTAFWTSARRLPMVSGCKITLKTCAAH